MAIDPGLPAALRALELYLDDIVVVGGWVPHLYEVFEPPDDGAVSLRTRDVDIAVPRDLREPVELQRASA